MGWGNSCSGETAQARKQSRCIITQSRRGQEEEEEAIWDPPRCCTVLHGHVAVPGRLVYRKQCYVEAGHYSGRRDAEPLYSALRRPLVSSAPHGVHERKTTNCCAASLESSSTWHHKQSNAWTPDQIFGVEVAAIPLPSSQKPPPASVAYTSLESSDNDMGRPRQTRQGLRHGGWNRDDGEAPLPLPPCWCGWS